MFVVGMLLIIAFMAAVLETLVEVLVGQAVAHIPALKPFAWMIVYIAVLGGIAGALIYRLDLIYLLAMYIEDLTKVPLMISQTQFGIIITGCAIGMGSARLHDLITPFFRKEVIQLPGASSG
jgi:hypothetical protein